MEVSLRKAGYQVLAAASAEQVLEVGPDLKADLIISDTELPGMDGFELRRRLMKRRDFADVPFIFLTREERIEDRRRGLELGVEEYLTRPIFVKEVVAKVQILLQRRASEAGPHAAAPLEGSLEDLALVDLLQSMRQSRLSGVIYTDQDEFRGRIYVRHGRVVDARVARLDGEEAFFRLLRWPRGTFTVDIRAVYRRPRIAREPKDLLDEGMEQLEEWSSLMARLPGTDPIFKVDLQRLTRQIDSMPEQVNEVLRLFDGLRTVSRVVEHGPFADLETARAAVRLYSEGLLIPVAEEDVEEDRSLSEELSRWLNVEDDKQTAAARTHEPLSLVREPTGSGRPEGPAAGFAPSLGKKPRADTNLGWPKSYPGKEMGGAEVGLGDQGVPTPTDDEDEALTLQPMADSLEGAQSAAPGWQHMKRSQEEGGLLSPEALLHELGPAPPRESTPAEAAPEQQVTEPSEPYVDEEDLEFFSFTPPPGGLEDVYDFGPDTEPAKPEPEPEPEPPGEVPEPAVADHTAPQPTDAASAGPADSGLGPAVLDPAGGLSAKWLEEQIRTQVADELRRRAEQEAMERKIQEEVQRRLAMLTEESETDRRMSDLPERTPSVLPSREQSLPQAEPWTEPPQAEPWTEPPQPQPTIPPEPTQAELEEPQPPSPDPYGEAQDDLGAMEPGRESEPLGSFEDEDSFDDEGSFDDAGFSWQATATPYPVDFLAQAQDTTLEEPTVPTSGPLDFQIDRIPLPTEPPKQPTGLTDEAPAKEVDLDHTFFDEAPEKQRIPSAAELAAYTFEEEEEEEEDAGLPRNMMLALALVATLLGGAGAFIAYRMSKAPPDPMTLSSSVVPIAPHQDVKMNAAQLLAASGADAQILGLAASDKEGGTTAGGKDSTPAPATDEAKKSSTAEEPASPGGLAKAVQAARAVPPARKSEEVRAKPLPKGTARTHFIAAEKLRRQQRYDEAIARYKQALQQSPGDPGILVGLGNTYYELRRSADALVQFQKAAQINPRHVEAYLGMGMTYQDLNRRSHARKAYERFLEVAPKHPQARDIRLVLEQFPH